MNLKIFKLQLNKIISQNNEIFILENGLVDFKLR